MADIVFSTAAPPPPPPPPPEPDPQPSNVVYGTDSSDKAIIGSSGNDIISGLPTTSTTLGSFTSDIMTGGLGNDVFVLGDGRGVFYNDGRATMNGAGDYARITDFSEGDRVQLLAGNYFMNTGTVGGFTGTRIWWDSNNNGVFETFDELIALVQGSKTVTAADFIFVAPGSTAVGDIDPVGIEASIVDVGAFAPAGDGDILAAFGSGPTWFNDLGSAQLGFAPLQLQNIAIA
jgi:Ca2+-binding RTX toxin-like protein